MKSLYYILGLGLVLLIISIIASVVIFIKATKNKGKDIKYNYTFSTIGIVIGFLLSLITSLWLFVIDLPQPVIVNPLNTSESSTIETSSETTSNVTTTEPPTKKNTSEATIIPQVENNKVFLNFTYTGEEIERSFTAPVSGNYRFDFIIDDVTCDYKITLFDSKNQEIFDTYYSYSNHGKNCRLTEGDKYRIVVTQSKGFVTGKIEIGVPEKEKVLVLE